MLLEVVQGSFDHDRLHADQSPRFEGHAVSPPYAAMYWSCFRPAAEPTDLDVAGLSARFAAVTWSRR